MFSVSLPPVSLLAPVTGAVAADDDAKSGLGGLTFAALLEATEAAPAGEPAKTTSVPHATLPTTGTVLPEAIEADAEVVDLKSPKKAELTDPASTIADAQPLPPDSSGVVITILTVAPLVTATLFKPAEQAVAVAQSATPAIKSATPDPSPTPARAVIAPQSFNPASGLPPIQRVRPERAAAPGIASGPPTTPPVPAEHAAPAASAALTSRGNPEQPPEHSAAPGPPLTPPVLPEQAAAASTVTRPLRGNPARPARPDRPELSAVAPITVAPTSGETPAVATAAPLRPVAELLAGRTKLAADSPAPLAVVPGEADPLASSPAAAPQVAPAQSAASPPAAPALAVAPTLARHDFAAMVDRLIEARDMAGAQPASMRLSHEDFGPVSLHFRPNNDGLTVTMASPDPDFARAVNAAAASGAAFSQSDPTRQGGDQAPSRQGGNTATGDDPGGQARSDTRSGARPGERDPSRQRSHTPQPQTTAPRQQRGSTIFA